MENRRVGNTPSLADSLATEASEGATSKTNFDARLNRYGKAKNIALDNSKYIRTESNHYSEIAHRIQECGNYLVFKNYFTKGEIRLSKARFCKKHLICPLCAIRRGAKVLSRYVARFDQIVAESPSLRPYLVTLTVKDGPDLAERFKHLQDSVKKYHHQRHVQRTICEAKKAHGAAWSYEIKRGKHSKLWHPHVHALRDSPRSNSDQ